MTSGSLRAAVICSRHVASLTGSGDSDSSRTKGGEGDRDKDMVGNGNDKSE